MRSLFLALLLANLVLFATRFDVVRDLFAQEATPPPQQSLNPEKLRIIRDTSRLGRPDATAPPPAANQPLSGTKN